MAEISAASLRRVRAGMRKNIKGAWEMDASSICGRCASLNTCWTSGLPGEDRSCRAQIDALKSIAPQLPPVSQNNAQFDYYPCCLLADLLCSRTDGAWQAVFSGSLPQLATVFGKPEQEEPLCDAHALGDLRRD